jgi:hypothetical protein
MSARGGRHYLSYVAPATVLPLALASVDPGTAPSELPQAERHLTDVNDQVGGGLDFYLTRTTSIGVGAERLRRVSPDESRTVEATRLRTTLSYRF